MNCAICKEPLDPVLEKAGSHPNCFTFAEVDEGDPFANMMKTLLTDVILWGEKQNPRGTQVPIGPSELGTPCDRRVGYRLAGITPVNTEFDPWPMIMGTAIHSWLEETFNLWNDAQPFQAAWLTEKTLHFEDFVQGHADLYNYEHQTVIDWKGAGPDVMRKVRKDGPPIGYQVQTHVYGYLFTLAGMPVKKVCLAFLPRAGWLRDMYVWCDDYSEDVAKGAIMRLYRIAQQIMDTDVLTHSHRWEDVEAFSSNDCGWCPWYNPGRGIDVAADDQGCPGR